MIRFACEKALLQEAITSSAKVVPQKSSIPALEGLLIQAGEEALVISGYNMNTGIRNRVPADVSEPGSIVVNARLIGDIFRRPLQDQLILFSADENLMVHITCGETELSIAGLSAADYPELPVVENRQFISIQQRTLRTMIEGTAFAVSTNESRPIHTGALFDVESGTLTMVAVDGFRLAIRREALEAEGKEAFSFVVPGAALNEVKNICEDTDDLTDITLGQNHILFHAGTKEVICRRLEGEFLDYKNAIPRKNPIAVTVDRKALIESVDRASVVISEKLKSPLRCCFDHDKIKLSAATSIGASRDVCPVSGDGGGLQIGFNHRYLMEALRHAPADTVRMELNTNVSPAIIVPVEDKEDFLYMVLPVRLKSGE